MQCFGGCWPKEPEITQRRTNISNIGDIPTQIEEGKDDTAK
jgi:hypothetical protein